MTWPACAGRPGRELRCGCTERPSGFDLADPERRWLTRCGKAEDLTGYLNRDTLIGVWPELHLPEGVRQAWEEHHPQLRAASPGTA